MKPTITYAAQKIGISQGYLSNILIGRRRPSPDVAQTISKWTETPLDIWLFKTKGNLRLRNKAIKAALSNNNRQPRRPEKKGETA